MELDDLWQENKRFVATVAAGAAVFLAGLLGIQSVYGDELSAERAARTRLERQLAEPRFGAADRAVARGEHEALRDVLAKLSGAVAFEPRPEFAAEAAAGSPVNHYHRTVAAVRERLLVQAGRNNLRLDRDLGLPKLSPSRPDEVERYLHGLDAVERTVRIALATGVDRIEEIRIRPDPALASSEGREGLGAVERTRVELELFGSGLALSSFLVRTQRGPDGPLLVETAELLPAPGRAGGMRLAVDLVLLRLHGTDELLQRGDA